MQRPSWRAWRKKERRSYILVIVYVHLIWSVLLLLLSIDFWLLEISHHAPVLAAAAGKSVAAGVSGLGASTLGSEASAGAAGSSVLTSEGFVASGVMA